MFPLWDVAIAPVLEAARARRVVEIGALRGETTTRLLERLGPDAELHVVDPVPGFDPAEHEAAFPGRYVFHRATSLEVLPTLGPVDAALVDGDHNWYTVVNELRLLAAAARDAGAPLPVLILHDVLWPYGRRDLYYAPERIPEEHRQPYAQRGIKPGQRGLAARGGLNPTMYNAEVEGGPRNGVMTALDDFLAEHDRPVRRVVVPIYFGLAIVVEEDRLAAQPALAAALDRLESAEGRGELLEVAEQVRLRAMLHQHNVVFERAGELERARNRHLGVVKAALLNEHYLDLETRVAQLGDLAAGRRSLRPEELRDPVRHDQSAYNRIARHRLGQAGPEEAAAESFVPYTAMGRPQLDHLHRCLDAIREDGVPGDLVECGTGRGGGAIFLRAYLDAHEVTDRAVWVADRFRAAPDGEDAPVLPPNGVAGFKADLNLVRDGFARFGLLDDRVRFLQGPLADTLADADIGEVALLRLGRGLRAADVRAALGRLYDRVAPGGYVVVGAGRGARDAVEAFRRERGIDAELERVDASALAWRKPAGAEPAPAEAPPAVAARPRAPLAPPAPADPVDLSVVVVFYDMRREAARTLHSLSRAYQEGIGDLSYEVLAVENGSPEEAKLGAELVESFGPEFRYLDLGDEAQPSPALALNRGIRAARGNALALMIDGAHVLTPGVLRFGMLGLSTYDPAVVVTQQWYVGPGQQGDAMDHGYDQAAEDALFARIRWPHAGYRLFEIGHFIGDRDWFDGVWESNCLFVGRKLLEQVGGFDESFAMAGGGYANLELYERLGTAPDVTVASILGEGSFHQLHGGTTTNQTDPVERRSRIFGYNRHFAELRGRAFKGPGKPLHFVGRLPTLEAKRTKPRRLTGKAFLGDPATGPDGVPDTPVPVPDELRWTFTEAVWQNLPWRRTAWLGRPIRTAPTDLVAYQQLLADVRPDWVIETGTGDGARALYLASVCELLGHGTVLSVDGEPGGELPQHPRLRYLAGVPDDPATVEAVREVVGPSPRALVLLGSCADAATTGRQFEAYAGFVPVGSYVVVTDTVVNGHPVWTGFGPGPAEAVKQVLNTRGDFVPDRSFEAYALTFNPGGYLRRVS